MSPIAAGTVNTNVALELLSGERLFLRVNEGKTAAQVSLEARVVSWLAQRGVPTPSPLASLLGAPYVEHGEKLVSLFPWVAGHHLTHADVGPDEARQVGEALAKLHIAGANFPDRPEGIYGVYTVDHLETRLASFRNTRDPVLQVHVERMAEALFAAARHREKPAGTIREGIIHQDLFMDNVLFATKPGKPGGPGGSHPELAALIDFEQAVWGRWIYDLAVCLLAWCFVGDRFVEPLVAAMVEGYESRLPLTRDERQAMQAEAELAAVRFAITRVTDVYLAGVTGAKDFRSYLCRLDALRRAPLLAA